MLLSTLCVCLSESALLASAQLFDILSRLFVSGFLLRLFVNVFSCHVYKVFSVPAGRCCSLRWAYFRRKVFFWRLFVNGFLLRLFVNVFSCHVYL